MSKPRIAFIVPLLGALAACQSSDASGPCDSVCGCVGRAGGPSAESTCRTQCDQDVATAEDPRETCDAELASHGFGQCSAECAAFGSVAGGTPDAPTGGGPADAPGATPPHPDAPPPDASTGGAVCGNGICEAGESVSCFDCSARLELDNQSPYVIYNLYVAPCGAATWGADQLGSAVVGPSGTFTLGGILPGCYDFLATSPGSAQTWERSAIQLSAHQLTTWTLNG